SYMIIGFIYDRAQKGVAGVTVTLSGAANGSATTDANGNYSFTNLLAGKTYVFSAAKTDYFVSPGPQSFNLLSDEKGDFSAIRFYTIKGQVRDGSGRPLFGILMSLTGPENASTITSSDGSYSFT